MNRLMFLLGACAAAGCQATPASTSPTNAGQFDGASDGYTVVGNIPDGVDIGSFVQDLPRGAFATVADPLSGDVAVIHEDGPETGRIASADFVTSAASCPDCVGSCATLNRTIRVTVSHMAGSGAETFGVQTYSHINFTAAGSTPSSWTQNVGTDQVIDTTGTVGTCGFFGYFFDVTGTGTPGGTGSGTGTPGGTGSGTTTTTTTTTSSTGCWWWDDTGCW